MQLYSRLSFPLLRLYVWSAAYHKHGSVTGLCTGSVLRRQRLGRIERSSANRQFCTRAGRVSTGKARRAPQVPVYNARLNNAVIEFHKHISKDAHYLATNCHICRKYLKEIKSASKKLQSAMNSRDFPAGQRHDHMVAHLTMCVRVTTCSSLFKKLQGGKILSSMLSQLEKQSRLS